MIKTHSDDPDVVSAAHQAVASSKKVLAVLPPATTFDYGGHILGIHDYGVCTRCTTPIAEAQAVVAALTKLLNASNDETVNTHISLALEYFKLEAQAAIIRAELHNGESTEPILNHLLAFTYERQIGDEYQHSHHGGKH